MGDALILECDMIPGGVFLQGVRRSPEFPDHHPAQEGMTVLTGLAEGKSQSILYNCDHWQTKKPFTALGSKAWSISPPDVCNLTVKKNFFFPHPVQYVQLPNQGSNSCPLQWKHKLSTTRPPGKSQAYHVVGVFLCQFLLPEQTSPEFRQRGSNGFCLDR